MVSRNPQRKIPNAVKEIIGQRMSLKTASSLDNRPIIKTEIPIPRNPVIINNSEILRDEPRIDAINQSKKNENQQFCFGCRKNDFQNG